MSNKDGLNFMENSSHQKRVYTFIAHSLKRSKSRGSSLAIFGNKSNGERERKRIDI